jgi:hypothetical protein
VVASAAAVRQWLAPFEGAPGVRSALLSIEGARECDLRAYLVVDPRDRGLLETFASLGSRLRRTAFPRRGFSRFPWPEVVTESQLTRSVLLRWTAAEPVARLRHGVVLFGDPPAPRATWQEIARGMLLDWLHTASQVREAVAGGRLSLREGLRLRDAMSGLRPALEDMAATGSIRTRHAEPHSLVIEPGTALPLDTRIACLDHLRGAMTGPVATLLDRVAAPAQELRR